MDKIDSHMNLLKGELSIPNEYTKGMGELIRKARTEKGWTQKEFAEKISKSQVTVSDIENGKVEITALTLFVISFFLGKPVSYFIPDSIIKGVVFEAQSQAEQEMLGVFSTMEDGTLQTLAIKLVKTVAELDEYILDQNLNPDPEAEFK